MEATEAKVNTMKIVCTIEARMRSTRLPGKVMMPIMGQPMLALMIERIRRAAQIDEIVIATTADPSCDAIVELAQQLGVHSYRGSEEDVLDRVLRAAQSVDADLIVETTGDCPLIDPKTINKVIETFNNDEIDYCANFLELTYPSGMEVQVFPVRVLAEAAESTTDLADREHVSLYIYRHPKKYRLLNVTSNLPPQAAGYRLTVDTIEDFSLVKEIYERLYPLKPDFGITDILELLERQPHLAEINKEVYDKAVR